MEHTKKIYVSGLETTSKRERVWNWGSKAKGTIWRARRGRRGRGRGGRIEKRGRNYLPLHRLGRA